MDSFFLSVSVRMTLGPCFAGGNLLSEAGMRMLEAAPDLSGGTGVSG